MVTLLFFLVFGPSYSAESNDRNPRSIIDFGPLVLKHRTGHYAGQTLAPTTRTPPTRPKPEPRAWLKQPSRLPSATDRKLHCGNIRPQVAWRPAPSHKHKQKIRVCCRHVLDYCYLARAHCSVNRMYSKPRSTALIRRARVTELLKSIASLHSRWAKRGKFLARLPDMCHYLI